MSKRASVVPPFRVHATGQGYVNLDGRRIYLGRADSREAKQRYARLIGEWEAGGRQPVDKPADLTIVELVDRFWQHVETRYPQKTGRGQPCGEAWSYLAALKPSVNTASSNAATAPSASNTAAPPADATHPSRPPEPGAASRCYTPGGPPYGPDARSQCTGVVQREVSGSPLLSASLLTGALMPLCRGP